MLAATVLFGQSAAANPPATTTEIWHLAYEFAGPSSAGEGTNVSISGDGRYTVFDSTAKLTDDAVGSQRYVYRRSVADGSVELVSTHARETSSIGASYGGSISFDGRHIAFVTNDVDSFAEDPGSGSHNQIVLKDMETGDVTHVSSRTRAPLELESLAGLPDAVDPYIGDSGSPFISADGRFVAFASSVPGVNNVGGPTSTVPAIEIFDATTGDVTNLTSGRSADTPDPVPANGPSGEPALSADGRYVVFSSTATNLGAAVSDSGEPSPGALGQIYRLDRETGELALVSASADDSGTGSQAGDGSSYSPSISADGSKVAFMSGAKNLLEASDVYKRSPMSEAYVRDLGSGATHRVSLMMDDVAAPTAEEKADHAMTLRRTRTWRESVGGASTVAVAADGKSAIVTSIGPLLALRGDCNGCQQFVDDNDALDVFSVTLADDGRPQSVHPISARRNVEDDVAPAWAELITYLNSTAGDGDSIADGLTPVTADGQTVVFSSLAQNLRGWDSTRRVRPGDSTFLQQPASRPGGEVITVPHYRDGGFPGSTTPKVRTFLVNAHAFASHLQLSPDESDALRQHGSVTYTTRGTPLPSLTEQPALVAATSSLNTASIEPSSDGIVYGLTVRAQSSGSAVVVFGLDGLELDDATGVPHSWTRAVDDVAGTVTYTASHVAAGDTAAFSFLLSEDDTGSPSTASVVADVNGVVTRAEAPVQPLAPTCSGADLTRDVIAGLKTVLRGLQCRTPDWRPIEVSAEHGSVSTSDIGILSYTADASYRGEDLITVATTDAAGRRSTSAQVAVIVGSPAEAVADTYDTAAGESLRVDPDHGLLGNDRLPTERRLWNIQQGDPPDRGTVDIDVHTGAFVYTPPPGFHGDATFRYRPYAPGIPGSEANIVTVTIHVR